jgi:hypothetical protein
MAATSSSAAHTAHAAGSCTPTSHCQAQPHPQPTQPRAPETGHQAVLPAAACNMHTCECRAPLPRLIPAAQSWVPLQCMQPRAGQPALGKRTGVTTDAHPPHRFSSDVSTETPLPHPVPLPSCSCYPPLPSVAPQPPSCPLWPPVPRATQPQAVDKLFPMCHRLQQQPCS